MSFFHLLNCSYNPHSLCLIVYFIPPGFTSTIVSHRNLKSAQPYSPTLPSKAVQIKEKCSTQGPKVVSSVENASGGILDASYPGQLPRNEQQVSNSKRHIPISIGQHLSGRSESNES